MKKKIKVLQVIPKLGFGGAETGCYDLAHFLPEKNCKSFLITSGGGLLKFINKEKVTVFKLPVQSKNPILIIINAILITGIAGTFIAILIMIWAQKILNPSQAAIIFTLEPVFAALFAIVFAGEILGLGGYIGGFLIVLAVGYGES